MSEKTEGTRGFVPPGSCQLIPYLMCDRAAEAIDFYMEVFDATEIGRASCRERVLCVV